MANVSAEVMTWTYETLTKVVLHTPSFLFDTEWLKQNTMTFTGLSIVLIVCIAIYEGFERLISGVVNPKDLTPMSQVYKRLPVVLGVSAVAPTLFYYGFQGLNWVTDKIISITDTFMEQGLSSINAVDISVYELLLFGLFDIALIGMLVPVFLQNFRRWFELLVLSSITPLALACWMFNSKEYLFTMWWDSIKKRSTTQLVYAIYILFIGILMFGTKIPETGWELLIKLGVMVGGLSSMANPPQIIRSHLKYKGSTEEVLDGAAAALTPHEDVRGATSKLYGFVKSNFLKGKSKITDVRRRNRRK